MKLAKTVALILLVQPVTEAGYRKPLGEIDFFGYKGFDVSAIREALTFREGDLFPPAAARSADDLKLKVNEAVKHVIGHEPTSVSFVCCDANQNWMVYIGLPGESFAAVAFNTLPDGNARLPNAALKLRDKFDKAWMNAVVKGHGTEDDSEGYTLTNDPKARASELAIRDYAINNEALITHVLGTASDARHRAIAALMLGYGRQSDDQIDALVRASLDPDDNVRNDAVRALEVLAGAKPALAQRIHFEPFVGLLRSGSWGDHNKATLLLSALTKDRNPEHLALLRARAMDSLMEMAQWRSIGHAASALSIVGRIAGIDEDELNRLIEAGHHDVILDRVRQSLTKADR